MKIQHFFDSDTSTLTYLVYDDSSKDAVIIDPVLDFDPPSGKLEDRSAQLLISKVREEGLRIHFILETHAHADHLSSSQILKSSVNGSLKFKRSFKKPSICLVRRQMVPILIFSFKMMKSFRPGLCRFGRFPLLATLPLVAVS